VEHLRGSPHALELEAHLTHAGSGGGRGEGGRRGEGQNGQGGKRGQQALAHPRAPHTTFGEQQAPAHPKQYSPTQQEGP